FDTYTGASRPATAGWSAIRTFRGYFGIAGYYSLQSSRFLVAIFIFDGKQSQGVRHRLILVRAKPPRLRGSLTSSLGSVDAPSGDGVFRVGRILLWGDHLLLRRFLLLRSFHRLRRPLLLCRFHRVRRPLLLRSFHRLRRPLLLCRFHRVRRPLRLCR